MRVPLNWLREYVDPGLSVGDLAELLISLGLGVEEILDAGPLGGQVLDCEITPNRGDLLSMVGLATELAAATGAPLRPAPCAVTESATEALAGRVSVRLDDPDLCPRYAARLVTGVRSGPSPEWLQHRLLAMGQRPIDILVDVTNYVMFELGQPLHAFDFAKLGDTIVVRRAREGEVIVTLDGQERALTAEQLLITDGERGVALAGVMGGLNTEVTAETHDILLEAAHFHGPNIRRTARRLGLESESSYRFARTVDPAGVIAALDRAAQLLADHAGGTVAAGVVDARAREFGPRVIRLRTKRCNSFLGTALTADQMAGYLRSLTFGVAPAGEDLDVTVPPRRPDLEREVDLIEEVARLHGYQQVPVSLPPAPKATGRLTPRQRLDRRVRELLLGCGLTEVQTFSLTSPAAMARGGLPADLHEIGAVQLQNALSEEFCVLRWSLIPSVLEVVGRNAAVHGEPVRVFEIGRTYANLDPTVCDSLAQQSGRVATGHTATSLPVPATEERTLAGAVTAASYTAHWNTPPVGRDDLFFEVKGLLEVVLAELQVTDLRYVPRHEAVFEPGRAAALVAGDKVVAVLGEVAHEVRERYDIRGPLAVFEANLGWLLDQAEQRRVFRSLPRQPAALRDVTLQVADEVPQDRVAEVIRAAAGPCLEDLRLFDVYRGKGLPAGTRSLAYSLRFRHPERTLTDAEVDEDMAAVIAAASRDLAASLRE